MGCRENRGRAYLASGFINDAKKYFRRARLWVKETSKERGSDASYHSYEDTEDYEDGSNHEQDSDSDMKNLMDSFNEKGS